MNKTKVDSFHINEQPSIDIKKYLLKGLSYWYLFFITLPIAYYIADISNKYIVPQYAINTKILTKSGSNASDFAGGLRIGNSSSLATDIGILQSYSLNRRAIEELDFTYSFYEHRRFGNPIELYKNMPFSISFDTTFSQTGAALIFNFISANKVKITIESEKFEKVIKTGEQFKFKNYNFNIKLNNPAGYSPGFEERKFSFAKNSMNSIVNSYASRVKADISPAGSNILWIWIVGNVPQKEADYLNKLVEVYIKRNLEDKNEKLIKIINFIDQQLEEVKDSLSITEDQLLQLKQQSRTVSISGEAQALIQKYNDAKNEKRQLKLKINYFNYISNDLKTNADINSIMSPEMIGISDATLSSLLDMLTDKYLERVFYNNDIKKNIPITKNLELEIESIKNQILNHSEKTINISKKNITEIENEIKQIDDELYKLPLEERRFLKIEKKFSFNESTYNFLIKQRMDAEITQASNQSDLQLLDPARPENAARQSSGKSQNTQKALMIGLIIPLIIIVSIQFLYNKIEDKSEIEKATKTAVIASIGKSELTTGIPVFDSPNTPITESFRGFRTNLQYVLDSKKHNIIAVTSSVSGEGKSFISKNIAAIIASSNKKTLLIGLDLRKPKLHEDFDVNTSIGASTYLSNNNTVEEVIQKTRIPNLDIILSGPEPPNPSELIESERMIRLLDYARENYDYTIIDTPPVGIVTDGLSLAKYVDSLLFVMRYKYTTKHAFKIVTELKQIIEINNLSIIFNAVSYKGKYTYGYGYGYGYQSHYFENSKKKRNIFFRIFKNLKNRTKK